MASTFVNYHLRCTNASRVARIAEEIITTRAFVSPATDGWITVCDETSQSLDPIELDRLAMEFSRRLETLCGAPIRMVSVGPERSATLLR